MRTKKKRARKKKRPRLLFILIVLIAIVIGGFYILSLPIWKIQEVVVSGANMLSAEEIRDLSGVPISDNLFFTSFARVRSNLSRISAIKQFHIYRIPPATVYIKIIERKPIAIVMLKDKSAVVDEEGCILNRNANLTLNVPNMTDLPVISGVGTAEFSQVSELVVELSKLLGSRRIQLETGGAEKINLLLDDILRVKIGRDEDIKRKMEVFKALLKVIEGRWTEVEYVDVRFPDNPVVKFK